MKINLTIRPDTRYKSERMRLYAHFNWTEPGGKYKVTRRSTDLVIDKSDWNFKRCVVSGNSLEATTIRDRIFRATDFSRTLDYPTAHENISAAINFINGLRGGVHKAPKMERFRDFVQKFIQMNKNTYSYHTLRKYETLIRNIELFCLWRRYTDVMQTMDEDQQVVFFSEYVDFLLTVSVVAGVASGGLYVKFNGVIVKAEGMVDPKRLFKDMPNGEAKIKREYENSSVKEDFKNIRAVCEAFKTGVTISLSRFTQGLKMGNTQGTSCSLEEIQAIIKTQPRTLTQEKAVDCFLFQAFTGARHNELYQVETTRITTRMINGGHIKVWTYVANKNGDENTVPLNAICMGIIEKWSAKGFKSPERRDPKLKKTIDYPNCLLPVLPSSKMNKALHEFLKDVPGMDGISMRVRYRGDQRVEEQVPRYMEITDHAARHTYSRILTEGGLSVDQVGELLNHASSETTNKHYKHMNENEIIARAYVVLSK